MIVRPKASLYDILFAVRGSIAGRVAWRCLFITVLACVVVYTGDFHIEPLSRLGTAPFGLIGIAISVFMSFRNSVAYDRWWEGRKQWGEFLVQVRSLSRELADLDHEAKRRIFLPLIGYAYALSARLRGEDEIAAARPRGINASAGPECLRCNSQANRGRTSWSEQSRRPFGLALFLRRNPHERNFLCASGL